MTMNHTGNATGAFEKYDLTTVTGVPPTDLPIAVLYNIFPNIQFITVNSSNQHVFGSYFNRTIPGLMDGWMDGWMD